MSNNLDCRYWLTDDLEIECVELFRSLSVDDQQTLLALLQSHCAQIPTTRAAD